MTFESQVNNFSPKEFAKIINGLMQEFNLNKDEKVDVLKTYMCLIVLFYLGIDSSFSCCFVKFPFRDLEEVSSFPESHLARADHVDCMFKCFIFR